MRLISLKLYNFRQFYGETPELSLAFEENKKVTVIHGNNGSGKTTLLNSFTWALYGKFTTAFQLENELVNKRAIFEASVGDSIECWVELQYEHGSRNYRVKRSRKATKIDDKNSTEDSDFVELSFSERDGRWKKLAEDQIVDQINKILPETLHQYFFFDGERIEKIVQSNKKSEISEATRTLLGLVVLDRSCDHLKEVKKKFQDELKKIGDPATQKSLEEQEEVENKIKKVKQQQDEIERELDYLNTEKNDLSQKLRDLAEVRQLQLRRDELEQQEKLDSDKLSQAEMNLKIAISSQGYVVLLGDATEKFRYLVNDLRERGELPADLKQQFVKDLLERQTCICGSTLHEGSQAYERVKAFLDKAGLAEVEETVIRMGAHVDGIQNQEPGFWNEITRQQTNIKKLTESLSHVEDSLDQIREQLRNSPREDIQKLEERLEDVERKIRQFTLQKGENSQHLKDLETRFSTLNTQIEKHKMVGEKQVLTQRRIKAVDEAISCLKEVRDRFDLMFRSQLETRIQDIFSRISVTPYTPQLSDKYELTLTDNTVGNSTPVAASQGENQILSLSFIGAIVDKVKEWSNKKSGMFMGPDSNTFPLVMDSPFGALDEVHRRQVSRSIPVLANQLIVLVSKTQWRNEVEQEMENLIGKMYVLSYHSPKPECERDLIKLQGQDFPLIRQSNRFEWTEVLEVF